MDDDDSKFKTLPEMNPFGIEEHPTERAPCLLFLTGLDCGRLLPLDFSAGDVLVGRDADVDLRLASPEISRHHARLSPGEGDSIRVRDLESVNGTFVNREKVSEATLHEHDKVQFGPRVIMKFVYQDQTDQAFFQQLYSRAGRDALTALCNRNYFMDCFRREWSFAFRHKGTLSLMMLDLDHFKQVNDNYGHPVGDEVLVEFASRVQQAIRSEDVLGRYGGEEFILLMRDTDRTGARVAAERMRWMINSKPFEIDDHLLPVTVSIGVATFSADEIESASPEEMIRLADSRMYQAKQSGRNRVVDNESGQARITDESID